MTPEDEAEIRAYDDVAQNIAFSRRTPAEVHRSMLLAALDEARRERDEARSERDAVERTVQGCRARARAAAIEECAKWVEERGWMRDLIPAHFRRSIAHHLRALASEPQ